MSLGRSCIFRSVRKKVVPQPGLTLLESSFSLNFKNLSFSYNRKSKVHLRQLDEVGHSFPMDDLVLKNFSASLDSGKLYCLLGSNGAGKSTLFKILLNLLPKQTGDIDITYKSSGDESQLSSEANYDSLNFSSLSISDRAKLLAYVAQDEHVEFMYKAEDVVLMSAFAKRESAFFTPKYEDEKRAVELMGELGISHLVSRPYPLLSGGERQLLRIARALFQSCPILIMDEPTTGLDYGFQMKILSWLKELAAKGYLVIFSSHNPEQAALFADELILLADGKMLDMGRAETVLTTENLRAIYSCNFKRYPILPVSMDEQAFDSNILQEFYDKCGVKEHRHFAILPDKDND